MQANQTPVANRLHIALFGRRNVGKSSLINALTNQPIAVVSSQPGTTTDPVHKTMELLPIGPVVIIDTPGLDDLGELGALRIQQTLRVLNKTELALLVIEPMHGVTSEDLELIQEFRHRNLPFVAILNKIDLLDDARYAEISTQIPVWEKLLGQKLVQISAMQNQGLDELRHQIILHAPQATNQFPIISDLLQPGQVVVLVIPIDSGAPKGRLILPQQQTLREILESDAVAVVTKEHQLAQTLNSLTQPPALVVTDSQVFGKVNAILPPEIPLTSFSILFARHKGELEPFLRGIRALANLIPNGKVLITEGCTHHRQGEDIGKIKIPNWLRQIAGENLEFHWASGSFFPTELEQYDLVVHCGGCMLNSREMKYRLLCCQQADVPVVNYGMLIAYVHGILDRALAPLKAHHSSF